MDSELPCRTFTGTVPVDQRARLVDPPREPVTHHVTLFRCGLKLSILAIAKLQLHGDAMDGYARVDPGVLLHFVVAISVPPLYVVWCSSIWA